MASAGWRDGATIKKPVLRRSLRIRSMKVETPALEFVHWNLAADVRYSSRALGTQLCGE
jgi:hypothetical protein